MARSSMADLITKARGLIRDAAGASQQFTDDEIQDRFDARRTDVRMLELDVVLTYAPNSVVTYHDFYAVGRPYWESDEVLQDRNWNTITADSAELIVAHWNFAASQTPPVYVSGKHYDLYGACADLLENWAADAMFCFDFATGAGDWYKLSQKQAQILALAKRYRDQANPMRATMVRSDAW